MNKIKKTTAIITLLAMAPALMAATQSPTSAALDWAMNNIVFVAGLIVFLTALVALWNTFETIIYDKRRKILAERGIELKPEVYLEKESTFKKIYDKAWSLIPMDKEEEFDLGHDYDGIRELDNRLPPWWVYTFYVTIFIGIGYLYVYHFSDIGLSQQEEYEVAMKEANIQKRKFLFAQANAVNEENVVAVKDAKSMQVAEEMFLMKCASCHGKKGEGLQGLGPNFTDQYWKHGGGIKNVFSTIKHGVPEKGMIAWKNQMQASDIQKLASYILTLEGTNPPNPKAPEGELWVANESE